MMAPTLSACAGAGAAADGSLVAERNASLASCLVRSTNAICCDASTGTLRTRTPPRCTARHRSGGTPTPIGAATVRERLPASPPLPNGRGSDWSGTRHHHLDPPALHGHPHLVGRPASRLRRRAGVRHRHPDRQFVGQAGVPSGSACPWAASLVGQALSPRFRLPTPDPRLSGWQAKAPN